MQSMQYLISNAGTGCKKKSPAKKQRKYSCCIPDLKWKKMLDLIESFRLRGDIFFSCLINIKQILCLIMRKRLIRTLPCYLKSTCHINKSKASFRPFLFLQLHWVHASLFMSTLRIAANSYSSCVDFHSFIQRLGFSVRLVERASFLLR